MTGNETYKVKMTKRIIGTGLMALTGYNCRITTLDGEAFLGSSWDSAREAYKLADMQRRIYLHSPAMYMGRTCVHLYNTSPYTAMILIHKTEREVSLSKLDVDFTSECYVNAAYGGYRC